MTKSTTHGKTSPAGDGGPIGLNENTGEFNVGEKITFGIRDGKILLRRKPQGEEVEAAPAEVAGVLIDAFFTDKKGA